MITSLLRLLPISFFSFEKIYQTHVSSAIQTSWILSKILPCMSDATLSLIFDISHKYFRCLKFWMLKKFGLFYLLKLFLSKTKIVRQILLYVALGLHFFLSIVAVTVIFFLFLEYQANIILTNCTGSQLHSCYCNYSSNYNEWLFLFSFFRENI